MSAKLCARTRPYYALVGNLDERITSHVLHSFVRLVSKLEELVDDSLEEFPVGLQESRVLTNDVHNIRRTRRVND